MNTRMMTWLKSLVLAVAVGVTMEVMEGVLRVGIVEVDDVILNALGVMSGYWICRVWKLKEFQQVLIRAGGLRSDERTGQIVIKSGELVA